TMVLRLRGRGRVGSRQLHIEARSRTSERAFGLRDRTYCSVRHETRGAWLVVTRPSTRTSLLAPPARAARSLSRRTPRSAADRTGSWHWRRSEERRVGKG